MLTFHCQRCGDRSRGLRFCRRCGRALTREQVAERLKQLAVLLADAPAAPVPVPPNGLLLPSGLHAGLYGGVFRD